MIARVYVQQDSVGLPTANESWCAVLVAINGANAPARLTATLPTAQLPGYITTAWTMLPFNSYSVPLRNGSAVVTKRHGSYGYTLPDSRSAESHSSYAAGSGRGGGAGSTAGSSGSSVSTRVLEDVLPANGVVFYRLSADQRNNELGCPTIK